MISNEIMRKAERWKHVFSRKWSAVSHFVINEKLRERRFVSCLKLWLVSNVHTGTKYVEDVIGVVKTWDTWTNVLEYWNLIEGNGPWKAWKAVHFQYSFDDVLAGSDDAEAIWHRRKPKRRKKGERKVRWRYENQDLLQVSSYFLCDGEIA